MIRKSPIRNSTVRYWAALKESEDLSNNQSCRKDVGVNEVAIRDQRSIQQNGLSPDLSCDLAKWLLRQDRSKFFIRLLAVAKNSEQDTFQRNRHKIGEPRCRGSPALSVDGLASIKQPMTAHRLRPAADHRSARTE